MKDDTLPERYEQPWKGRRHPVFVYPSPSGVIWGITAELIREYLDNEEILFYRRTFYINAKG
ncbi:MAG: hypothetical protein U5N26_00575 [Candidatus Marinimicrobia bacterium]|nr:hypothetical protein [Candidatus Neomarinimicrobiota bacterium]